MRSLYNVLTSKTRHQQHTSVALLWLVLVTVAIPIGGIRRRKAFDGRLNSSVLFAIFTSLFTDSRQSPPRIRHKSARQEALPR
jgi:hypothetical protein